MEANKTHWEYSDTGLIRDFESGVFPLALFSHEAHLRLAWIYLSQNEREIAEQRISHYLREFTRINGAEDKFHKTLTLAAMKAVWHFMHRHNFPDFEVLLRLEPRLKTHFNTLIRNHYSKEILESDIARHRYLEPDLQPF